MYPYGNRYVVLALVFSTVVFALAPLHGFDLYLSHRLSESNRGFKDADERIIVITVDRQDADSIRSLPNRLEAARSIVGPECDGGGEADCVERARKRLGESFDRSVMADWRPVLASFVEIASQSGADVVALDVQFEGARGDLLPWMARAVEAASSRKPAMPVVVGRALNETDAAGSRLVLERAGARAGVAEGFEANWFGEIAQLPVFDRPPSASGSEDAIPSFFVQAFCATRRPSAPFVLKGGRPRCGDVLSVRSDRLTLWPIPEKIEEKTLRDVLSQSEAERRVLLGDKTVIVGFLHPSDRHRTILAQSLPRDGEGKSFGVYLHAQALLQLVSGVVVPEIPRWSALTSAFLLSAGTVMLRARRRLRAAEGVALALVGATWCGLVLWPCFFPVGSFLLVGVGATGILAWPRVRMWLLARRLVATALDAERLTRARGWAPILEFPSTGSAVLARDLSGPPEVESQADDDSEKGVRFVSKLYRLFVEDRGRRLFLSSVPPEFFRQAGFLEANAEVRWESGILARIERVNDLRAGFCGAAIRRIRDLLAHGDRLDPHTTKLAHDAFERYAGRRVELSLADWIRIQRALLSDVEKYFAAVREYASKDPSCAVPPPG